jgi:TonB-linked SusC/RagA family outer membrane protein
MKNKKFLSLALFLLTALHLTAQTQINVSGTVTDSKGEAVVGASVVVQGTTLGVITGATGSYSIQAPDNGSLVITFLGYASLTEAINGRTSINLSLSATEQEIDEVVVVGVSMRKSDLTGAVASVSAKTLEEKPVTSINEALQGRVAGVFISQGAKPGDEASIKIRGTNSINLGTDPIYVVDGVVMDNFKGSFSSINLNDVQSIEVLKDASATALYGARAANGVVVVTTKKGKAGQGRVTYDGWVGIQQFKDMPATMDATQMFELRQEAARNAYAASFWPSKPTANQANNFYNQVIMDENAESVFSRWEFESYRNGENYSWLDLVTQTGIQQNHAVSFSGGADRSAYYLSFGYSDKQGLIKNMSEEQYTGRINAEHSIKPWLKVGTNTAFTRTNASTHQNDEVFWTTLNMDPLYPINDQTLSALQYEDYGGYNDVNGYNNPINTLRIENDRIRNRLVTNNYLNINPLEGLNLRTSVSVDYMEEARYSYIPSDIYQSVSQLATGIASHSFDSRTEWQWDASINYDKTFGDHKINLIVGASASRDSRRWTDASARNFAVDDFGYHAIHNSSSDANLRSLQSDFSASSLVGYLARANYSYRGKYLATVSVRRDGSSKFAPDYRWGTFPSLSAAWNIMEENFMQSLIGRQALSSAKLRAGFGMVGNQSIDNYAYTTLYNASLADGNTVYTPQGRRGTPNITWEKQQQYNLGLDLGLLNSRVQLSADFFYIMNRDLLLRRKLATTTGFTEAWDNVGVMQNQGVEFSVNAAVVKTKDISWNISATFSRDRNEIVELFSATKAIYSGGKTDNLIVGKPRNTIYIWENGGIAQLDDFTWPNGTGAGKEYFQGIPVVFGADEANRWGGGAYNVQPGDLYPIDQDGNNKIDEYDNIVISADPMFYGGFATDLSWKGVTLNAVFSYSYGGKKLSARYEQLYTSVGNSPASPDLVGNMWSETNTGAAYPRPVMSNLIDKSIDENYNYRHYQANQLDISVQDGSFLRLSTLTLSYTFPQQLMQRYLGGAGLRIYATGSNLFCLTPYGGFDPEMGDYYPAIRMYVLGINLSL